MEKSMMEIFKEMWDELPNKVRITAGIVFTTFLILCVWACMYANHDESLRHNHIDANSQQHTNLVQ